MTDAVNEEAVLLGMLERAYREVVSVGRIEDLSAEGVVDHPNSQSLVSSLAQIKNAGELLDDRFLARIGDDEAPIVSVSPELRRFYHDDYKPHRRK